MVDIAHPSDAPEIWAGTALRGAAGGVAAYLVTGLTLWVVVAAAFLMATGLAVNALRLAYRRRAQEGQDG